MKKILILVIIFINSFSIMNIKANNGTIFITKTATNVVYEFPLAMQSDGSEYRVSIKGRSIALQEVVSKENKLIISLNILDEGESNILIYHSEKDFEIIRADVFVPKSISIKKSATNAETSTYKAIVNDKEDVLGDFKWLDNGTQIITGSSITIKKTNLDKVRVSLGDLSVEYTDFANSVISKIVILGIGIPLIFIIIYFFIKFAITGDPYKELLKRSKKMTFNLNKTLELQESNKKKAKSSLARTIYISSDMTNVCRIIQTLNETDGQLFKGMARHIIQILKDYEISALTISQAEAKNILKHVLEKNEELYKLVEEQYLLKPTKGEAKKELSNLKKKLIKDASESKVNNDIVEARYNLENLDLIKSKTKK